MRIGIVVQVTDLSIGVVELARAIEERGFDSLYLPEHTHLPVREAEPAHLVEGVELNDYRRTLDPYIALAAAAAVTKRIQLGTCVSLVTQHDPIVLAKELATLDHLAEGRIVLGFGYGWNRAEMEDHGVEYSQRRRLAREKLLCMAALWSDEVASFEGEFINLAPCYSWPKPYRRPKIRTLAGGGAGPTLFRTIAELCDGWMPIGGAGLSTALAELRRVVEDAGRDPADLDIIPIGTVPNHEKLGHYAQIGVTEVVLRVPARGRDEVLRVLDRYVDYLPS